MAKAVDAGSVVFITTTDAACSVCSIIYTQNKSGICARCTNRPHEHHGFALGRLMTDRMGREFSVFVERAAASDTVRITARCNAYMCRRLHGYDCAGDSFRHYFETDREKLIGGLVRDWECDCAAGPDVAEAEPLVDGLTIDNCLSMYEAAQRNDDHESWRLTPLQFEAARTAWSSALRERIAAKAEKERREIVVDDDRWEG